MLFLICYCLSCRIIEHFKYVVTFVKQMDIFIREKESVRNTMSSGPPKKIPKLIEKYELGMIEDRMVQQWTHPDPDRRSTTEEIKTLFNEAVLRGAMKIAGMDPVPGEVEYGYQFLSNSEEYHAEREDFVNRISKNGVDINEVQSDFINSRTTFYNYLTNELDATHPNSKGSKSDDGGSSTDHNEVLERFEKMRARYENVSLDALDTLRSEEKIPSSEYQVTVDFVVEDTETGDTYFLEQLLSG